MSALDLKYWLIKARDFLAAVAPITPLKTDDSLVTVIDAILADATLFGYFEQAVADEQDGKLSFASEHAPVAIQGALQARQIDWQKLITFLPTIIELVRLLRG